MADEVFGEGIWPPDFERIIDFENPIPPGSRVFAELWFVGDTAEQAADEAEIDIRECSQRLLGNPFVIETTFPDVRRIERDRVRWSYTTRSQLGIMELFIDGCIGRPGTPRVNEGWREHLATIRVGRELSIFQTPVPIWTVPVALGLGLLPVLVSRIRS